MAFAGLAWTFDVVVVTVVVIFCFLLVVGVWITQNGRLDIAPCTIYRAPTCTCAYYKIDEGMACEHLGSRCKWCHISIQGRFNHSTSTPCGQPCYAPPHHIMDQIVMRDRLQ